MAVELSSVPSLTLLTQMKTREGEKIEIINKVASKWKYIGVLLDFDKVGLTLQQIEADRGHEGVESCCRAMFQHWLEGNGVQPVSWATLLEILEDCLFTELAERIKAALTYEFQCECCNKHPHTLTHKPSTVPSLHMRLGLLYLDSITGKC